MSKPDYQLEYVYTKSKFRRTMWIFLAIYLALRVCNATLYFTVGLLWLGGIPAAYLIFFTGLVIGAAIYNVYLYRRSVKIRSDKEAEDNPL